MRPAELDAVFFSLSAQQRRCVANLLGIDPPPTYPQVAAKLGLHVGTVHRYLGRVRQRQPAFYAIVMTERRRQLASYHLVVAERRRERSLRWGRRRAAGEYRARHGVWPWADPRGPWAGR